MKAVRFLEKLIFAPIYQVSVINMSTKISSMAKLIDGKLMAQTIQEELRSDIQKWVEKGHRNPCLIAVLVGNDEASKVYVRNKMSAAESVGIKSTTINLPESTTESELIARIESLNKDNTVDGILIQLPIPEHISERNVCDAVSPAKDVDGFHINNIGRLCLNNNTFVPCTALAVIEMLKRTKIDTFGKTALVCGRSKNVGLPISLLLHSDAKYEIPGLEATTILCHRNTKPEDLRVLSQKADIVITATGVRNLIKADMVKKGACVIDVGIIRIKTDDGKTKLVGDVDFDEVSKVAGYITPVPGGVGPMTVAMLMKNTFKAAVQIATGSINM